MKRDRVVELIGWRLGDRTDMVPRILAEMDFIQTSMLEEHEWLPWFLESEVSELICEVGERRIPLPVDFLTEIEESDLWLLDENGNPASLSKDNYDILLQTYPGTGRPKAYCLAGKYFHLFPAPDAAYKVQTRYYGRDALMSAADVETLWLKYAADLVVALVGEAVAGKHIQNPTLAAEFTKDVQPAWARLLAKHTALEEINQSHAMGENT